jgi:hypothetical protein
MGLLSFLFGGKKEKAKAASKPKAEQVVAAPSPVAYVPVSATTGVAQAKLRLKLAASLRAGEHAAASEAARGLADIQIRAGRKTVARVWQEQAERIKAEAGLAA